MQALIELSPAGSEERATLESISNHLAGRGTLVAVQDDILEALLIAWEVPFPDRHRARRECAGWLGLEPMQSEGGVAMDTLIAALALRAHNPEEATDLGVGIRTFSRDGQSVPSPFVARPVASEAAIAAP